jgi:AcrR family transcriptional regulator
MAGPIAETTSDTPVVTPVVTPAAIPTRERILYTAAELFRRQGYAATGIKQITGEADATLGSLYHFFPQGKLQLAHEVLRIGGAFFLALYRTIAAEAPDLPTAVENFFTGAGETLVATGYADACPIATVAGEIASTHEQLRLAVADVFESWLHALTEDAIAAGVPAPRARPLAESVLALLEGAFLLARSMRSTEPMTSCGRSAVALVLAALPTTPTRGRKP